MAQIEYRHGIATGTDGDIVFASCNQGPRVNGRWTWRGYYCTAAGPMDPSSPVEPALWARCVALMREVGAYMEARHEEGRAANDRRLDALDAAYDRVAQVRGGPLDPNSY